MEQERISDVYRPVNLRMHDFDEVERVFSQQELTPQAERCMNCGIPFCHGAGCPLGNVIPEFNAAYYHGDLGLAWLILSQTSFFPEFTSRVCPALCEGACTHGINNEPVMIRQIEKSIIETAFAQGWVKPSIPARRRKERVAVIGSGPSGLYAAEALNRFGFNVTVYERNKRPGGLMRYGIPDFKLAKRVIDRRLALMQAEGITFVTGAEIGKDISASYLQRNNEAIVLAIGTPAARDLKAPNRSLQGVHFALEFLQGQNRVNNGEIAQPPVSAAGKRVLVIGGGDTGSDCVGTATRQGARSVEQVEIMPKPPETRSESTPWPNWPYMLRTSSSHKEGCERRWNISTRQFLGNAEGNVTGVEIEQVDWQLSPTGRPLKFSAVPNSVEKIDADLILLAMGFTGVPKEGLVTDLGLNLTPRTAIIADPARRIFAAGDCANGASLVVRAMADGWKVAQKVKESF